ncbi:MAG: TnpV protein [Defluviitaleaceae bacterium]|nr:TnpV protein [Defluviitaleaceae bacterium]
MSKLSKEYIPVVTNDTVYFKPQTKEEMDSMIPQMKLGDMMFLPWVFSKGMWYTLGLNDETDLSSTSLFPNIIMDEHLPPLTRWGLARYDFLKTERKFMAAQFGTIGLHKHCLEIQNQAEQRKRDMIVAIRNDPANRVTECDKAQCPISWVQRMNMFQAQIHEVINSDLIFS